MAIAKGDNLSYNHDGYLIFCKPQLFCTNVLCQYQVLSFYEMKSFTRALQNTDIMVSGPKCSGKWLYFITKTYISDKLH